MLFSSYIVIRTTSSWMRSCPITRFDTKKANVKELPSFESCHWLHLHLRLVGVLNFGNSSSLWSKAKRSCSQSYPQALSPSPTVYREYSLYMRAWLTPDMMPCHTDVALVCSRSIIRDLLHQRYFPSDSCWTFKTGPKCSTSGEWDPYPATQAAKASFTAFLHHVRSQATKRTRRRTPWMSELSSRLLKALLWESLPYP